MAPFDTPRLHLRPLRGEDASIYCALYTDASVMAHIGTPLAPVVASRQFADACRFNDDPAGVQRRWAVIERASGAGLGLLALLGDRTDPGNAELGVMLLPGGQGRGLARELNDAVLDRAFGAGGWGLHRVWARHASGHAAAAQALFASGFEPGPRLGADATVAITSGQWLARRG